MRPRFVPCLGHHVTGQMPGDEVADAIDRFVIVGGGGYDELIAVTAKQHLAMLLTRDERAAEVYERMGTDVGWVST